MKFTIVTINYNNKDGLRQTIISVIEQLCQDFEYIIIDGGSRDGSLEVIKEYNDKIDYWESAADSGIYHAMNKGLLQVHGDWVIFMNSGDVFANKEVLGWVDSLVVPENIGIIYGDSFEKDASGQKKYLKALPFWESKDYLHHKGICHQSSFTKALLAKKYQFDQQFMIAADYKMFYEIYMDGFSFYYLPQAVSVFDTCGICHRNRKQAFKEDAIILGKYKTLKYYYFYLKKFYYYRLEWAVSSRVRRILNKIE